MLLADTGLASAQDTASVLREGDAAMSRGEFVSAIRHYGAAIAADPKAAILHTKRAAAYAGLGEHKQALRDLDAAVDLDSGLVQGYLHRGRLLRDGTSKEVIRTHLAAVFEVAQDCIEAKLVEANLLLADQDYGGVAAVTGHLLKGEPGNIEALYLRGTAYFYLNDQDLAKRHFGEALKYDPDHEQVKAAFRKVKNLYKKKGKAEAAEAAGQWSDAETAYLEALSVDQAATLINTALWLGLCRVRYQLKKPAEAVEACSETIALQADSIEAIVLKVKALIMGEEYDSALREAQAALEAHQNDRQVVEAFRLAERAQKMAARKDYYKILGVARTVGEREVKRAYRDLARKYHPDKAAVEGLTVEQAQAKFMDIAEAYEILSDEEKRGAYDRGEDIQPQGGGHPGHGFQGGGFPGGGGFGFPGGHKQQYTFRFG
ncbi:hypothetical protein WJX72_009936 [[Myrmecia] bisecta]|uniref:J domain-containing protein n=1 Tax=[Myrmecia] bisecta TaxID=41462 RepID=A0AAW1PTQ3_9CHLO